MSSVELIIPSCFFLGTQDVVLIVLAEIQDRREQSNLARCDVQMRPVGKNGLSPHAFHDSAWVISEKMTVGGLLAISCWVIGIGLCVLKTIL